MAHVDPSKQQSPTLVDQSNLPVKHYILYVLIGGLIASALISIVAVLAGQFGDTAWRAFATTLIIVVHSLIGLAFLSVKRSRTLSAAIIMDTLFGILIASMITAVLGIWNILASRWVGDLYTTYLFALIALLLISGLLSTHRQQDKTVNAISWSASGTIVVAFVSLLPWIFAENVSALPEFYFRVVAALVILAATMTILTAIFDRLFIVEHPEPQLTNTTSMPLWVKILLGFVALLLGGWIIIPLLLGIIAGVSGY